MALGTDVRDPFPLISRYQAAWNEHGVRIGQRQSVIQLYLTVAGVIYGFWFTKRDVSEVNQIDMFLVIAVTLITAASSALVWMHNRVIQKLTHFMKDCEACESVSIEAAGGPVNLFYFCTRDSARDVPEVDRFHLRQRRFHRAVFYVILIATNALAIALALPKAPFISALCAAMLTLAIVVPLRDLEKDSGINREAVRKRSFDSAGQDS